MERSPSPYKFSIIMHKKQHKKIIRKRNGGKGSPLALYYNAYGKTKKN